MNTKNEPQTMRGASATANEYLSFRLGAEEYGIEILKVQEIRGFEHPTRIVNTPADVLGVLNLRGVIVPIIDLRIRFGMQQVPYNTETVTIVLNLGSRVVGMVVDGVSDVVALQADQVKPPPELKMDSSTAHVVGIATIEMEGKERMLILIDVDDLMHQDIAESLEAVQEAV